MNTVKIIDLMNHQRTCSRTYEEDSAWLSVHKMLDLLCDRDMALEADIENVNYNIGADGERVLSFTMMGETHVYLVIMATLASPAFPAFEKD